MGPGAGSPSEPTVLKDVELPEPRGEVMAGVAGAAFRLQAHSASLGYSNKQSLLTSVPLRRILFLASLSSPRLIFQFSV